MARLSNAERLRKIHSEALSEFDTIQSAVREVRMQCLEARRFYSIPGAQWEGALGEQFENKPRFEFNKVHLGVIRIISEYRNNRITVDFQTPDGSKDDKLADTCDGLYRSDEKRCTAEEAYDNAFEEGVGGGMGAIRLCAEYEDEDDDDNDRQRVVIKPVFDADSTVFFNLDAKRQDKADAKRCYVLTPYSRDGFIDEFKEDPASWSKDIQRTQFDWATPDLVWVCELYKVEEQSEMLFFYRGLDENAEDMKVTQSEIDADENMLAELAATGFRKVREKRVKRRVVHKYLLSGGGVLEDCGVIAGKCIPVVPFYGKRWVVDGVERCMGHVQLAMDAQRLTNMLMSWLAEMAARFDIEKPILTPEQIAGHVDMWSRDAIDKFPYLLINPITDENGQRVPSGPVAYTKAPNLPPVMAALAQIAEQALQDLLGGQQAGEQLQPNMSGKAVELIQNRLDMQVFIYMSNFAKMMRRCGEVWLSMMKDIVVEDDRRMKTIAADGEIGSVVMNRMTYDPKTAETSIENDLTKASFEVDVDVGPSSSSLRSAVVRALTGVASITEDPETKQALTLATIANLEGEGLADLREWARGKAIRMGLMKPTEEEQQELAAEQQQAKPDAQQQYLQAAAESAQADAGLKRAKTVETAASADLKQAQAAKTIAETQGEQQGQLLNAVEAFRQAATPPDGMQDLQA